MFKLLPEDINVAIYQEGKKIYSDLIAKYPEETRDQKDFILNSLCFALVCFMRNNVNPDNYPYFMQLVHKILKDNS